METEGKVPFRELKDSEEPIEVTVPSYSSISPPLPDCPVNDLLAFCHAHYLNKSTTEEWQNAALQQLHKSRLKTVTGIFFSNSKTSKRQNFLFVLQQKLFDLLIFKKFVNYHKMG